MACVKWCWTQSLWGWSSGSSLKILNASPRPIVSIEVWSKDTEIHDLMDHFCQNDGRNLFLPWHKSVSGINCQVPSLTMCACIHKHKIISHARLSYCQQSVMLSFLVFSKWLIHIRKHLLNQGTVFNGPYSIDKYEYMRRTDRRIAAWWNINTEQENNWWYLQLDINRGMTAWKGL